MNIDDADFLADLARELDAEPDLDRLLRRVINSVHRRVPGADHVGITVLEPETVTTPVATDELVRAVDRVQHDTGEGPSWPMAVDERGVVRADDLAVDRRWPLFAPRAVEMGVRGVLSVQLWAQGRGNATLNIYTLSPGALSDDSVQLTMLAGAHASLVLSSWRKESNLQVAVAGRDVIGRAKGILMERFAIDGDQAFQVLVEASQRTHRKLRDVAEELALTGQLIEPFTD